LPERAILNPGAAGRLGRGVWNWGSGMGDIQELHKGRRIWAGDRQGVRRRSPSQAGELHIQSASQNHI
jgi:hypothetical protein